MKCNYTPGVDVRAGTTVKAPVFSITGDGIEYFGAYRPGWRQDGSRVSYRNGMCTLNSIPERSKSLDQNRDIDLWIAKISGGTPRLLVRDGFAPSWR